MTVQEEKAQRVGPQPGTWYLDPLHSNLIFVAHYLKFGRVQGTLNRARGRVWVAEDPRESKVEVTVNTASLNTGVKARDTHLRSADFLDVERYPEMRFVSTGIETPTDRKANAFILHGSCRCTVWHRSPWTASGLVKRRTIWAPSTATATSSAEARCCACRISASATAASCPGAVA